MGRIDQEISNCLNNIELDFNLRDKVMDTSDAETRIKNFNTRIVRKRVTRNISNFIIIFALIIVVSNTTTYAIAGKNIFEVFFAKHDEYVANELLDYNGQSYQIDDYTITLEQTLYDNETGIGYLVFSIAKEAEKTEIILNKWNQCVSGGFGENQRFYFDIGASNDATYEYIGDKLYAYINFSADKADDLYISLVDSQEVDKNNINGYKMYMFNLKETTNVLSYKMRDNVRFVISPLGIAVFSNEEIYNFVINIYMKNGDVKKAVNTKEGIGIGGSSERVQEYMGTKNCEYKFVFREMLDVSEIEQIEINNEVLINK